jgi:cyclophilin family peptidyl-prolyl cis-trans isomerase
MATQTSTTCSYCYIDLDLQNHRSKLATAAAFVHATDARYGFTSSDLRALGGSELARISQLLETDHEWSGRCSGGIVIRPPAAGNRIVVQLYRDVAPLACENFATLCGGGSGGGIMSNAGKEKAVAIGASGKPLTYNKSMIHRVIPGFILQGGDFVFGNGSGGESIFGKKFKDERAGLALKHDQAGVLSLGNSGKNSNTSQFFMTFAAAPQCDGKHVVFGRVVSGWEVLDAAQPLGTVSGEPSGPIEITDCGVSTPLLTPGAGYWYDQPDPDSYTGTTPVFMVRPRVVVVATNAAVADKFHKAVGTHCSVVTVLLQQEEKTETDERAVVDRVSDLLKNFAVDVVLVAPACKHLLPRIRLDPSLWTTTTAGTTSQSTEPVPASEVILQAKPVDAMTTVRTQSWLAKRTSWQLDGMQM